MTERKVYTDDELVELSEAYADNGHPTIGDLATEVLRLRKIVGETKVEGSDFNRWIEATKIKSKCYGEHTEVLILTDAKEMHFQNPEFQHCECLIRYTSHGHPSCMAGPAKVDRRVLESWGVLPKKEKTDERSG